MIMKVVAFILLLACAAAAEEWKNLWPGGAPGAARPPEGTEVIKDGWRFREVEVPQYFLFRPEKPNGMCILILPGGGYGALAGNHEGKQVGEWLAQRGITGVVVKYRVSGDPEKGYHFPVPQMDARRAVRLARSKAEEWKIDPKKVGVMGFSAGGHLASTCLTMFDDAFEEETKDEVDALSCRPDFGMLIYPVISMSKPHGHTSSAKRLLGENPPQEMLQRCDTALRVTEKTPPTFIVHSADDKVVTLRNATDFMEACAEKEVPVTAHIYPTGGHGYGFPGRGAAEGWAERLGEWLDTL